jgi:hypothetical protein
VISNYRAIIGPLTIDVSKPKLTPIIGVNESGKTTVLHALFAFDHYNDDLNDDGRHLEDTANLYRTNPPTPTVAAVIALPRHELDSVAAECEKQHEGHRAGFSALRKRRGLPTEITITRNLATKKYSVPGLRISSGEQQHALAEAIISRLPYILFFDDFRDKIEEKIEIIAPKDDTPSGWLAILQQLFKSTDEKLSVFQLPALEERQRKSVLAKVQRRLNETLTKEWQNFRLDDRDALEISVDFVTERTTQGVPRHYLKLDVVEVDSAGDQHFFFISDRSKGFYWFFNFVMKLEFNPKVVSTSGMSIYLLDEPGSYLHAFAQRKLCNKLRQLAEKNCVLYCTHSHYLLDPDTIPVSSIQLADKDGNGSVSLLRITDFKGVATEKRSALQPVLDALQIRPFALDVIGTRTTIVVEGIYDYFALEMFRGNRPIAILPATNADSVRFFISLLIAWQIEFRALWDNDKEGRLRHGEAGKLFGEEVAKRHLRLLPSDKPDGTRILQSLFDGSDLQMLRTELELAADSSFERTLHAAFYSPLRGELTRKVGAKTRQHFEELFDALDLS